MDMILVLFPGFHMYQREKSSKNNNFRLERALYLKYSHTNLSYKQISHEQW